MQKSTIKYDFEVYDELSDDDQDKFKKHITTSSAQQGQQKTQVLKSSSEKPKQEQQKIQQETSKQEEEIDDTEFLHKNISKIYTIKFSQTGKTVAIGTEDGIRIQQTEKQQKGKEFKRYIVEKEKNIFYSGIKHISLMFDTFICAFVTDNKQKQYPDSKVYIWDQKNCQLIGQYEFYSPIMQIYYMREFLLVASESRLVLYNIIEKKPLKYILDIYAPQKFVACQNYDTFTYCYLQNNKGIAVASNVWFNNSVQIDFNQEVGMPTPSPSDREVNISNMVLSHDGSLVAMCEKGGNYIKIFDTERGKLKCTLYRGKRPKIITDMQFKKDLTAFGLISTSELKSEDEGTIHIFDISVISQGSKVPIEKLKDIRSQQFNFDIYKRYSYSSKESKFQGPLIQFDPLGANSFTIYSESDYTISQNYDLTSEEPKKRINDNLKQDGWIDPIQEQ